MKKFIVALILLSNITLAGAEGYTPIEDQNNLKILTPALAERKTAKIRLNNGLEAYLVSDPGATQSAAALAVEAGSWQDPKEYPGMAHFLEHMLFMGTKAYPSEAEYMQYMTDHGGERNAYTAPDHTNYIFSVNHDGFKGALDRFSHFFIDPLFLKTCIDRELFAVDQEHAKNIENDNWRNYMILKETGNPDHPNSGFSTGNAETLSGIPQEALKKWYREHYSAHRMHLVAISNLPIEELVQLTVERFSAVPSHSLPPASYPNEVFSSKQKGHFIYIQPVKDLKSLSLIWQLPTEIALDNETGSASLISYALGNGAENSLYEELKREKLAEGLMAGKDRWSKTCNIFEINISLTEAGVKQLNTVISRVYQALNRLKETGIPKYIFDEKKQMAVIDYEYQSRVNPYEFVQHQSAALLSEKLETFPQKLNVPSKFDPALAQLLLQTLTPDSCIYIVLADPKLTSVIPDTQEKWMNASYAIREIPQNQLTAWTSLQPHPLIDLPSANPYLPQSLALIPTPETKPASPLLIADENSGKIYYQQDAQYLVPETAALFALKSPLLDGTAKSKALFDVYIKTLSEKLSSELSFASQAGIGVQFYQGEFDFNISVTGLSEKAPLFLDKIFHSLQDISPTAAEFEIYKQSLLSQYDNASKELPVRQGMQLLNSLIYNYAPSPQAKFYALSNISYEDFLGFLHEVFKTSYAEGLIFGNLTAADAQKIWSSYKTALSAAPFPISEHYKKGVLLPSKKEGPYMISQQTERQGNSVALMLYEGAFSMEKRAIQQILSSALKDDFFDTLRTKQQTGYIVSSWDIEAERNLLQTFVAQSITHHPSELLARFELFLEDFSLHTDEKISSTRFETLKASLVEELSMPPDNLPGKAHQLDMLAFEYEGDFNWIQKRIEAVKNLTYDQFLKTASSMLSRKNKKRIAVLMEGVLPEKNQFRYEQIAQEDLPNIGEYVNANFVSVK